MIVDRYRAAGLRTNPFTIEAADPADPDRAAAVFVDRGLPEPPPPGSTTLVQLIGDKGAGKSTHVRHWQRRVEGPYHYVPRVPIRGRFVRPPVGPIVYADEIDRLPAHVRRSWFRASAAVSSTIVAGTHRDLSGSARRAGLRVVTHHLGPADHATLRRFVDARLDVARCSHTACTSIGDHELAEILLESAGNLRTAEGLLHALVADHVHALDEPAVRR